MKNFLLLMSVCFVLFACEFVYSQKKKPTTTKKPAATSNVTPTYQKQAETIFWNTFNSQFIKCGDYYFTQTSLKQYATNVYVWSRNQGSDAELLQLAKKTFPDTNFTAIMKIGTLDSNISQIPITEVDSENGYRWAGTIRTIFNSQKLYLNNAWSEAFSGDAIQLTCYNKDGWYCGAEGIKPTSVSNNGISNMNFIKKTKGYFNIPPADARRLATPEKGEYDAIFEYYFSKPTCSSIPK
jgi:hypothetical protein